MTTARTAVNEVVAAVFADATVDEVRDVFVATFVQAHRFTEDEARDMRGWAVAAMTERVGAQATAEFVVSCGAEAVVAVCGAEVFV